MEMNDKVRIAQHMEELANEAHKIVEDYYNKKCRPICFQIDVISIARDLGIEVIRNNSEPYNEKKAIAEIVYANGKMTIYCYSCGHMQMKEIVAKGIALKVRNKSESSFIKYIFDHSYFEDVPQNILCDEDIFAFFLQIPLLEFIELGIREWKNQESSILCLNKVGAFTEIMCDQYCVVRPEYFWQYYNFFKMAWWSRQQRKRKEAQCKLEKGEITFEQYMEASKSMY